MTEAVRRQPTMWGRSLTALGGVALAAVCIAGGAALWTSFWRRPAPEPCALSMLPVPRPGDVMAWSPDGARLLVANRKGEAWIVHFPDHSVQMLPRFGQTPWDAGWDAAGRPLLIFRVRYPASTVVRLDAAAGRWMPLPVRGGNLAISASGRWIAGIQGGIRSQRSKAGGPTSLMVWDAATGALLAQRTLPGRTDYRLEWSDRGELTAFQLRAQPRNPLTFRWMTKTLQPVAAHTADQGGKLRAEYVAVVIPGERTREQARQVLHLGNAPAPAADWHLWLRRRGAIQQDLPLGRRVEGRIGHGDYHTWKSASISPDGRYVVARAADDTLRFLDLRSQNP